MRKKEKDRLLSKFARKDSREEPIWPEVRLRHHQIQCYVRIKRHGVYFLVYHARDIGDCLQLFAANLQLLNHDAHKAYRYWMIDLKHPFYDELGNVPVTAGYYDKNQEDEEMYG